MLNVGIIGTGLQANRRASSIATHAQCKIKSIAGIVREELDAMTSTYKAEPVSDWLDMVNDPEIDIVVICTPPNLHYQIAEKALLAGKHVLCEKPLTMTSSDALKLYHLANNVNKVLKCGFNHRFHPAMLKANEIIKSGKIGRIITGRAVYGICGRNQCENEWRSDPNYVSGGQLMEQGVHIVDLFRWYMGEFESISADVSTQVFSIEPLEDTAVILLHGKDGITATLHSSITQWRNRFRLELYGTEGYLEITGLGGSYDLEQLHIGLRRPTEPFTETVIDYRGNDKSWKAEWEHFIEKIVDNKPMMGTAMDGAIANYIIENSYVSSKNKCRVTLGGMQDE
jgi:lmbZ